MIWEVYDSYVDQVVLVGNEQDCYAYVQDCDNPDWCEVRTREKPRIRKMKASTFDKRYE